MFPVRSVPPSLANPHAWVAGPSKSRVQYLRRGRGQVPCPVPQFLHLRSPVVGRTGRTGHLGIPRACTHSCPQQKVPVPHCPHCPLALRAGLLATLLLRPLCFWLLWCAMGPQCAGCEGPFWCHMALRGHQLCARLAGAQQLGLKPPSPPAGMRGGGAGAAISGASSHAPQGARL